MVDPIPTVVKKGQNKRQTKWVLCPFILLSMCFALGRGRPLNLETPEEADAAQTEEKTVPEDQSGEVKKGR